jgi:hypothetical protein
VAAADRISSLPQKARLRILSFLPFKAALALEMVSRRWFALVNKPRRSLDSVLGIHIHSATGRCGCALGIHMHSVNIVPSLTDKLDRRGRGPGRRLLRFILEVEDARMRPGPDDFALLLDYAADCDVEDVLLVDARPGPPALSYNFERTSRRLVGLTLHGVHVGGIRRGRSYGTLEVIRIESTNLDNLGLTWILLSCPRLRVLELRRCGGITRVDVTVATARLLSLTVARCPRGRRYQCPRRPRPPFLPLQRRPPQVRGPPSQLLWGPLHRPQEGETWHGAVVQLARCTPKSLQPHRTHHMQQCSPGLCLSSIHRFHFRLCHPDATN